MSVSNLSSALNPRKFHVLFPGPLAPNHIIMLAHGRFDAQLPSHFLTFWYNSVCYLGKSCFLHFSKEKHEKIGFSRLSSSSSLWDTPHTGRHTHVFLHCFPTAEAYRNQDFSNHLVFRFFVKVVGWSMYSQKLFGYLELFNGDLRFLG